jgi:hypothetical protein
MFLLWSICILYYDKLISTAIFGILVVLFHKTMILSIKISTFCHISKTVKPKNDFSFSFESSCDFEHININPESIWIQNAVCRRVRSFWLVILFRALGGDLCKKEEHFYVLESDIKIIGLSRNRISNWKVVAASLLSPKIHKLYKYKENDTNITKRYKIPLFSWSTWRGLMQRRRALLRTRIEYSDCWLDQK